MNCDACGTANPDRARFCLECGEAFPPCCPACGERLPGSAKFCVACGAPQATSADEVADPEPRDYTPRHLAEKILASRPGIEGERKQVTVLFVDVMESTELAGALDPEAWHRLLDGFFQILTEGVHRLEGTINQYTGDGIMALFGAPIAHEDHAQRACYATLHLKDRIRAYTDELRLKQGINLGVRFGMNSGEVVVGRIGDDLRMDYTAQGQVVALAQRMEQLAEPGAAFLTEATARQVEGFFRLRDVGPAVVKGLSAPLQVYALEGPGSARTRLDAARISGLSRFVGRREEIASLESALERALAGSGQVVGVVAEAGTGKSRLCSEFVDRSARRGFEVYQTHCPMHGKSTPRLPVLELLRAYFGVEGADDPRLTREKVAGRLLLLDPEFEADLPLLFDFLGVPDAGRPAPAASAEILQLRLNALVRRLISAHASREPLLLFVDDMHWIDDASDRFVAEIVEAVAGTRTLLLLNFRPEYTAGWFSRSHFHRLPLAPLDAAHTSELVSSMVGDDPSLAGLAERIFDRTHGNPFFTEEIVQTLIESGDLTGSAGAFRMAGSPDRLSVPATVQAVLQARIDRLQPAHKSLLQQASVIGRRFDEPLLTTISDLEEEPLRATLSDLVASEFLLERAIYPVAEYAFKHPLTHQVAYESQLQETRARTHRKVAASIERLRANELEEVAAVLARHWEEAGEVLTAATWHRRAALWMRTSDPAGALPHWLWIHSLADELSGTDGMNLTAQACYEILQICFNGTDVPKPTREAALDRSRTTCRRLGDYTWLVKALCGYSACVYMADQGLSDGLAPATEALALAEKIASDDPRVEIDAHVNLADVNLFLGNLEQAHHHCDRMCELTGGDTSFLDHGRHGTYAMALARRAQARHYLGRFRSAGDDAEESVRLSEASGREEDYIGTAFLSQYGRSSNVADSVRSSVSRQLKTLAESIKAPNWVWMGYLAAGETLLPVDPSGALVLLQQSMAVPQLIGSAFEALGRIYLAEANLALDQTGDAKTAAEAAVEITRRFEMRAYEALAQVILARALIVRGSTDPALHSALSRAELLIAETGANGLLADAAEIRDRLA